MKTAIFTKPCSCGHTEVKNARHFLEIDEGKPSPMSGWYAECAKCNSTRFVPEIKLLEKQAVA